MGLLSRLLLRRTGTSAPGTAPEPVEQGNVLGSLGTLISQVHQFQQSPMAGVQMNQMLEQAEGLQAEIGEIVARHGFDPSRPPAGDAVGDATEMQREIMEAMSRRGFGTGMVPPQAPPDRPPEAGGGPIRDPLAGG